VWLLEVGINSLPLILVWVASNSKFRAPASVENGLIVVVVEDTLLFSSGPEPIIPRIFFFSTTDCVGSGDSSYKGPWVFSFFKDMVNEDLLETFQEVAIFIVSPVATMFGVGHST